MTSESTATSLRRLILPVYLPWGAFSFGMGMMLPILPLYLEEIGLSFTTLSLVMAATGVGATLGGLPVGAATRRLGENKMLVGSVTAMAVLSAVLGLTQVAGLLILIRLATGMSTVGIRLSRQAYVARTVEGQLRGRAMSLMGGLSRLGFFIGPPLGGVLTDQIGFAKTFAICGVVFACGAIPIAALGHERRIQDAAPAEREGRLLATLRPYWRHLVTSSIGPALIIAARRGRLIVIPLIADELGLSATAVGLIVAVGTGADLLLFPVSGYVMDRFGRLYATIPAFGLMGLGLLLLGTVDSTAGVTLAGAVVGVGNGLSAGTLLTMGSDLAPPDIRAAFLAGFGSLQDLGGVLGPIIVGWSADQIGLDASAIALAVVLFLAIMHLAFVVGETRDITH
ncbi:MAG: MFS transporter [Acidimicrobiales bacterium]